MPHKGHAGFAGVAALDVPQRLVLVVNRVLTLEVHGLEVFGHHGAEEGERAAGQRFLFDVELRVSDAALSDRIDDAVDYRLVAERIRAVSGGRRFHLLEALAAAIADAILAEFPVEWIRVRVRKPDVRAAGVAAEWTAATVERAAR